MVKKVILIVFFLLPETGKAEVALDNNDDVALAA